MMQSTSRAWSPEPIFAGAAGARLTSSGSIWRHRRSPSTSPTGKPCWYWTWVSGVRWLRRRRVFRWPQKKSICPLNFHSQWSRNYKKYSPFWVSDRRRPDLAHNCFTFEAGAVHAVQVDHTTRRGIIFFIIVKTSIYAQTVGVNHVEIGPPGLAGEGGPCVMWGLPKSKLE